jgi:DNA-binding response OmpR family regulator
MSAKPRVLIADDDQNVSMAIRRSLEEESYQCDCVPDGETALASLRIHDYNLLIADIRMPGNDGLQLVQKAAKTAPGVPVILITGNPSVETAIDAMKLPVFAYVLKPFELETLLQPVRAAVRWNQAYRVFDATEARIAETMANTAMMHGIMASSKEGVADVRLHSFFAQTLGTVAGAIMDLNQLFVAMNTHQNPEFACSILGCPRAKEVENSLVKAVGILRASKEVCKSKEIAAIRRSLENELLAHRARKESDTSKVL